MKKILLAITASLALILASSTTLAGSHFSGYGDYGSKFNSSSNHKQYATWGWGWDWGWKKKKHHKDWKWKDKDWKHDKDPKSVPEIDAAGAGLALALMGGLVAIVRERRRKQS